jgi:GT2 family glycosyltransferase
MKKVVIVVLNWNGWRDALACLRTLQRQDYENFDIVIVDNASTDDSVNEITNAMPGILLLQSGGNLGFGGGCNVGIRHALQSGADYVWLINSDATVSGDALSEMVLAAEHDKTLGLVGAVIFDADRKDEVQLWGGGTVQLWTGASHHLRSPGRLDFISGASALLRCSALKEVGLFDSKTYFMYWEDTDLSFRLRTAGWKIGVAENARVWHRESSSLGKGSPMLDQYFTQSGVRFLKKYSTFPVASIAFMLFRMVIKRLLLKDWSRLQAVFKGLAAACIRWPPSPSSSRASAVQQRWSVRCCRSLRNRVCRLRSFS